MSLFACIGFITGLLLPITAGRFGKILPADPGLALLRLWHRPHFPRVIFASQRHRLISKWKKLGFISILWGLTMAVLFVLSHRLIGGELAVWGCVFCVLIGFCIFIDERYFLLPDFFTVPLLLSGFMMSCLCHETTPMAGITGAVFGYLIATVSVLLLGLFERPELGAGDVKMITALGAWLGVMGLNYTILISFFLFAMPIMCQSKRRGAYGPALGIAALITFFFIYAK